jgi:hypothetical protein
MLLSQEDRKNREHLQMREMFPATPRRLKRSSSGRGTNRACYTVMDRLLANAKALLLHEGNGTLLGCVQGIIERTLSVGRISEIVAHI